MIIELSQTTASKVNSAIYKAHRQTGTSAMAFTLVVVTEQKNYETVLEACLEAGREHPARVLIVVNGRGQTSSLDAEIRTGDTVSGDVVTLRINGELVDHAASIVLPLLLPDSPTVVWWPNESPVDPASDQIGALATRRITDASGDSDPVKALRVRAEKHSPGDTDLTWTRLTPWRALLAASLDQYPARIQKATIEAAKDNAPAELLAAWLEVRLGVEVEQLATAGPGITGARLTTAAGDIELLRDQEAAVAQYSVPGQPKRLVALQRRGINELITEELRRMDPDAIFEQAIAQFRKTGAKKSTGKKAASDAAKEEK